MLVVLRRIVVVAILVAASSLVLAPTASAITATQTIPADGSSVPPPLNVRVVHDQALNPLTSSIAVRDKNSDTVAGSTSYANTFVPNDTIVFTPSAPLTEALSDYEVTAIGRAVVGSDSTTTDFSFTVDTTPPAAPDVTAITNPVNASNQSAVATRGTAEPESLVSVYIFDGTTGRLGQVAADEDTGEFLVFVNVTDLVDGGLTVDVSAKDEADNVSPVVHPGPLTKDTVAPAAPTVGFGEDPVTSGNQSAITISGTTDEDGLTIDVSVDDDNPSTPAVTDSTTSSGGAYSVQLDLTSLNQGTLTATATATDAAANVSDEGSDTATKETGAPVFVTSSPLADATVAPPDSVTVTYNEALAPTSTITVVDGTATAVPGTTTFDDGDTTLVFTPDDPLTGPGGPYTVTSVGKDLAANTEDPPTSFSFSIDSTPPDPPEIIGTDPDVRPSNETTFQVAGEAEADSTVEITVTDESSNEVTGTTTANSPWDIDLDVSSLDDGVLTVTATATDGAGNTSEPSLPTHVNKYWYEVPFFEVDRTVSGAYQPIEGDFDGDGTSDIFWYAPGTAPDYIWLSQSDGTYVSVTRPVSGSYTPIAGNYAGDLATDILWYAPGPTRDFLWVNNGDGSFVSHSTPINGTYTPIQGHFIDDTLDDVFFYRPGPASDLLLVSNGDGSFEYVTHNVRGSYTPIAGDFDADGATDIFWYGPGSAPDSIWRSLQNGSFESITKSVSGTYTPITGDFDDDEATDIFWYQAGSAPDYVWLSHAEPAMTFASVARPVSGSYSPVIGDYDQDGDSDVFWYGVGSRADWVWLSGGDGTFASIPVAQDEVVNPISGDHDGDTDTDIFWYGPGSTPDELWLATLATTPP